MWTRIQNLKIHFRETENEVFMPKEQEETFFRHKIWGLKSRYVRLFA